MGLGRSANGLLLRISWNTILIHIPVHLRPPFCFVGYCFSRSDLSTIRFAPKNSFHFHFHFSFLVAGASLPADMYMYVYAPTLAYRHLIPGNLQNRFVNVHVCSSIAPAGLTARYADRKRRNCSCQFVAEDPNTYVLSYFATTCNFPFRRVLNAKLSGCYIAKHRIA